METKENKNHQFQDVDFLNGKNMAANREGPPIIQKNKVGKVELRDEPEINWFSVRQKEADAIELIKHTNVQ